MVLLLFAKIATAFRSCPLANEYVIAAAGAQRGSRTLSSVPTSVRMTVQIHLSILYNYYSVFDIVTPNLAG